MIIKPIKTKKDHREALARIEQLMSAKKNTPEGDELDVLVTLVSAYEDTHYPVNSPTAIGAIEYELEKRGWTRKDLEPMIGSSGRVSEVLSGKRNLSIKMIRALHKELGIPLDILVADQDSDAA